jgi:hypothetical protein
MKTIILSILLGMIITFSNLLALHDPCDNQTLHGTNCGDYTCSSYTIPIGEPDGTRGQPNWKIYYCYRYCDGILQLQITQIDEMEYWILDHAKALAWATYVLLKYNPDIFLPSYQIQYLYRIGYASCWKNQDSQHEHYETVSPTLDHTWIGDGGWIRVLDPCDGVDCCVQDFNAVRTGDTTIYLSAPGVPSGMDNCENATPVNQCFPICQDVFTHLIMFATYNGYPPQTILFHGNNNKSATNKITIIKSENNKFYCRITSNNETKLKLSIFDLQGNQMPDKIINCSPNYNLQELDFSTYTNGIYFIYVYEDNLFVKCEKIIIVN